MTHIDPKITRFTAAPIRRKPSAHSQKSENSSIQLQADQVELRKDDPRLKPEEKPKKSLGRRVFEKTIYTALLASSVVGAFAGLGVYTNREVLSEALNQEQPIQVFGEGQQKENKGSTGAKEQTPKERAPSRLVTFSHDGDPTNGLEQELDLVTNDKSVSASLSSDRAQALVSHFRESHTVQEKVSKQLSEAEGQITEALSRVEIPNGEALLTARVPFPSGEGSLVQLAGLNIPTGLKKLAMEDLPLVLTYEVDPVDTGLSAKLSPAQVDQATLPRGEKHGLHLGAIRAEVAHKEGKEIPISGKVKVALDDGTATMRALEKETDPAKREALQNRLKQIDRIEELAEGQNIDFILDFLADNREVSFAGRLQNPNQKVADGVVHAWLTPDRDQDSRADVTLSGNLYTPAVDQVKFQADKIDHVESQAMKDGGVTGYLQNKIAEEVESAAKNAVPGVMDALRGTVHRKVQERFAEELSQVEENVDQIFDETLDAADESVAGVGLDVAQVDIDPATGALVAQLDSDRPLNQSLGPKITLGAAASSKVTPNAKKAETTSPSKAVSGETLVDVVENSTVAVDYSKPSVVIPGSSARRFLSELLKQEEVQEAFQSMTEGTREEIAAKAQKISVPAGSVDIQVETAFPSQENVDSPLGKIPKLERKNVPFRADYELQEFGVDVDLSIKPIDVKQAVRPEGVGHNGVFIGAVQVGTAPTGAQVKGQVSLHKQATEGGAVWAEQALDEAFQDQNFSFQSSVSVGETESLFYIWVTPDTTGDGKADVAVAHRSIKSGAEAMKVKVDSVDRTGENRSKPDSLGNRLNGVVSSVIQNQLEQSGDRLGTTVSRRLEKKIDGYLTEGATQASTEINEQLSELYGKLGNLEIPVPEGMNVPGGKLKLELGDVKVQGDAIVSEYGNENTARILSGYKVETDDNQVVAPGELRAHVPGVVFNQLLRDTSVEGPLDWNSLLDKAADDSSAVKSLGLAKDENGKTISPSIKVIDGKPTLTIQLDGETNGIATPVSAGARLLPGFVGDGLGWITDNTVGALLGSRLQTEVQVPLNFGVENGKLAINPGDVKFETPEKLGFNIADILPTRLLSGLIVDGVASAFGPDAVNDMLAKQNLKADLTDFGLQWTRVEVKGKEGSVPNLTVGVSLGENLPEMVSDKAAEMRKAP